jgi:hypothetical protein
MNNNPIQPTENLFKKEFSQLKEFIRSGLIYIRKELEHTFQRCVAYYITYFILEK